MIYRRARMPWIWTYINNFPACEHVPLCILAMNQTNSMKPIECIKPSKSQSSQPTQPWRPYLLRTSCWCWCCCCSGLRLAMGWQLPFPTLCCIHPQIAPCNFPNPPTQVRTCDAFEMPVETAWHLSFQATFPSGYQDNSRLSEGPRHQLWLSHISPTEGALWPWSTSSHRQLYTPSQVLNKAPGACLRIWWWGSCIHKSKLWAPNCA